MIGFFRKLLGITPGPGRVPAQAGKQAPLSPMDLLIQNYHLSAQQNDERWHNECLAEMAKFGNVAALPHILSRITEMPPSHDNVSRKSIAIARFGAAAVPHLMQTLRKGISCVQGVDPFAPGILPKDCEVRNSYIGWGVAKVISLAPHPKLALPFARYVYIYSWRGDTHHHASSAFQNLGNVSLEPLAEFLRSEDQARRKCGAKYIEALGSAEAMSVLREYRQTNEPGYTETAKEAEEIEKRARGRAALLAFVTEVLSRQTFETMSRLVPEDPIRWVDSGVPGFKYQLNWYYGEKDIIHCEAVGDDAPYAVHTYFMRDLPVLGIPLA